MRRKVNQVDYARKADAAAVVAEGDRFVEVNCQTCQGMGSGDPKSHGYCPVCKGDAYVKKTALQHWDLKRVVDYWQARALLAEAELLELDAAMDRFVGKS